MANAGVLINSGGETSLKSSPTSGGAFPPRPTVPDHEMLRIIGQGAYGDVWLAQNILGEYRAVKVVWRREFGGDNRPFEREFEGIKRFEPVSRSHPSQLAILHVGKNDAAGYFYYVMELADAAKPHNEDRRSKMGDGKSQAEPGDHSPPGMLDPRTYVPLTLRWLMRDRGPLPAAECLEVARSLASALAHLHAQGLVHRDIKPSNVIFVGGVPKLADVGLVTTADEARSFVGTEGYVPPEGPGTPSADCYGLGKLLYELSSGQDRTAWPEPPADLAVRPDREGLLELNAVIHRACAPDPRQRYANAEAMLAELELLQAGRSVKLQRTWSKRWVACKKVSLAVGLLALATIATIFLLRGLRQTDLRSSVPGVDDLVEQGNFCVRSRDNIEHAIDCFDRATKLAPKFVPAYFGRFTAANFQGGMARNASAERDMRAVAAKLKEIAPSGAESLVASSVVKWVDWDFRGALADAHLATQRRAASKEGLAAAHSLLGFYLCQSGKPTESLRECQIAKQIYPSAPLLQRHIGHPYFVWHKFDVAMKYYQEEADLAPVKSRGDYWKGRVYEETTNFTAAIKEFEGDALADGQKEAEVKVFYDSLREAVNARGPEGYWKTRLDFAFKHSPPDLYYIATLYARLANPDKAYEYLESACTNHSFTEGLMFDLCWDHNDPKFQRIAKRIGILQ